MTAQPIKPILTLLAVQSDDSSGGVTLWNAPVKLIKAILSKQPEISEAMKAKGPAVDWTETPAVRSASGAIASAKDAAGEGSHKVAHWLATLATSAQENIRQLTVGSTNPLQNAASQVKGAIAQTTHSATDFLHSTQSSLQTTIQGTVNHATTSTTTFFQTAVHHLQSSTAEFGTEATTGLGNSVETATFFTLEKVGQALSGASWLVVKSYLWVSSKVSTGAQQAILETTGAETATPDSTLIVNAAPEISGWVVFAEVCGVVVFYVLLGWYAFWVWQNLPYKPGNRFVGKPDFDPSRWIWWSQASPEAGLDQPQSEQPTHPEQLSHLEQPWNWRNLPYTEVLKGLIGKTGTSDRSSDQ